MGLHGRESRGIISPELLNSWSTKATRSPRLDGCWSSDDQLLECGRNIVSKLSISQRGTSGEQQIKLAIADETHVSDANARVVVCRGGFPGRCKIPDLQISAAATEKTIRYQRASP